MTDNFSASLLRDMCHILWFSKQWLEYLKVNKYIPLPCHTQLREKKFEICTHARNISVRYYWENAKGASYAVLCSYPVVCFLQSLQFMSQYFNCRNNFSWWIYHLLWSFNVLYQICALIPKWEGCWNCQNSQIIFLFQ